MEAPYAPVLPCLTVKQQKVSTSAVMQHPCSSRAHACCVEGVDERSSPPSPAAGHNTTTPSTTKRRRHNASPTTPCTALGAGGGSGRPPTLTTTRTTAMMKTTGMREAVTRPPPSNYSDHHPVALPLMAVLIIVLLMPYADAASVVGRRPPTDALLTAEQRRELLVVWASGRKTQDSDVYAPAMEDVSSLQQVDTMTKPKKTSHSNFDIRTFAVPDAIVEQPGDFAGAPSTPTTPQRLLFEPLSPTESIDRFVTDVEGSGGDVVAGLSVVDVRARIVPERDAALAQYNYTWRQGDRNGDDDELDGTASLATRASEHRLGATTSVPPPALFFPRALASTVLPQPLLNTDDDGDEAELVEGGVRHAAVYYDESSNNLHDKVEQPAEEDTDFGITYLLLQNASSPHPNSIYSNEYNSTNDNDNNRLRQPRATTESQRQRSAQGDAFGVSWNETDYGVEGDSAINTDTAYDVDNEDAQEDNRLRDRSIPYDDRQAQLDNSLGDDRGRQPSSRVVVPLFSSQTTSSPNAVLLAPMGSEQKNEERMQDDENAVAGANRPNSTQLPTTTTLPVITLKTPTLFEDQAQRDAEETTSDDLQNRWHLPPHSAGLAKTRANGGAYVREPHSEQDADSDTEAVNSVRLLPTVSTLPTTTLPYQFELERTTQLAGADNWSGQTDEEQPWTWMEDFDETSSTSGTLLSGQSSAQDYADEQQTAPKRRTTTANILNVVTPGTTPGASSKPAETWQNRWRLSPGQRARLRRKLRKLRSAVQTYNDYLRTWCVDEATGSRFVARHRMCRHWQNAKIELYEQKIRLIYGDDTGDWPERQQTWFAGRRRDDRFYTYFF